MKILTLLFTLVGCLPLTAKQMSFPCGKPLPYHVLDGDNAEKRGKAAQAFPDGTPIDAWMLQTKESSLQSLGKVYNLADYGVESNPGLVQTEKIQAVIDKAAVQGGGVIYIPGGIYKTGAIHFKQGTHLYLDEGAVLLGSENIADYPLVMTRIEGQNCKYFSALINAEGLDGFSISGQGIIDGNGTLYWKAFRLRRQWNPDCTNKDEMRPRLLYVAHSRNITVSGVTLQNSPFWTSHYYKCDRLKLMNLRIYSPNEPVRSASADGIDLDVCSNVLIKGCRITTNDDGICFKGGRGPEADKDVNNGFNEKILIEDCFFDRTTSSCITCGSEAIHVRNVLIRNCRVDGRREVFLMKMRPDTPQVYEYISLQGITGSCMTLIGVSSWKQFFNLEGHKETLMSYARHIKAEDVQLKVDRLVMATRRDREYELVDFDLRNVKAEAAHAEWNTGAIDRLSLKNVTVTPLAGKNGR